MIILANTRHQRGHDYAGLSKRLQLLYTTQSTTINTSTACSNTVDKTQFRFECHHHHISKRFVSCYTTRHISPPITVKCFSIYSVSTERFNCSTQPDLIIPAFINTNLHLVCDSPSLNTARLENISIYKY